MTVKDLLKVLYEKACQQKLWGLVCHAVGMLGKRVEDLAKSVTDLLVRQKQVIALLTYYMSRVFLEKLIDTDLDEKCTILKGPPPGLANSHLHFDIVFI